MSESKKRKERKKIKTERKAFFCHPKQQLSLMCSLKLNAIKFYPIAVEVQDKKLNCVYAEADGASFFPGGVVSFWKWRGLEMFPSVE